MWLHLAVGCMTTEETDIWTLCMPLPSVGLVGAGSSPGSGQDVASAAGGESYASGNVMGCLADARLA